jgi:hypothetical protein
MAITKILVNCKQCSKEFLKIASQVKKTKNNFCSIKCSTVSNAILNKKYSEKKEIDYYDNPKRCVNCSEVIPFKKKNQNNYCSIKCSAIYLQKNGGNRKYSEEDRKKISEWAKKYAFRPKKTGKDVKCIYCDNIFYKNKASTRTACSKKCYYEYAKSNNLLKNRGMGGLRLKGGRGKQGWYKGYFCNSSWELAWVIYNLDHNIKFQRNTCGFPYIYQDKKFKFFPDFIMESDNNYVEIKGYMDEKNQAKIRCFPYKLTVLDKLNIKTYLDYVQNKYGKDFISLYEISS